MGRDDVPQQDVFLDAEIAEDAVHDRRRRFGRACAGELALGGERDPRDACTAVPGGLADKEERRVLPLAEVAQKPVATRGRALAVTIKVERCADRGTA